MSLWINDSGATTAEIEAGVHAAARVFENLGWRASLVHRVMLDDEHPQQEAAREMWSEAESAAFRAAFSGWARWPEAAILVWDGE